MENPFEARKDCEQLAYCSILKITTENCFIGANIDKRCRQSEMACIILLSKIIDQLKIYNECSIR